MATPIATPPALRMLASSSVIIRNSATAIASFDEGSVSSFSTDVLIFVSPREERLDTASGLGKKAFDDAAQSTSRASAVRIIFAPFGRRSCRQITTSVVDMTSCSSVLSETDRLQAASNSKN